MKYAAAFFGMTALLTTHAMAGTCGTPTSPPCPPGYNQQTLGIDTTFVKDGNYFTRVVKEGAFYNPTYNHKSGHQYLVIEERHEKTFREENEKIIHSKVPRYIFDSDDLSQIEEEEINAATLNQQDADQWIAQRKKLRWGKRMNSAEDEKRLAQVEANPDFIWTFLPKKSWQDYFSEKSLTQSHPEIASLTPGIYEKTAKNGWSKISEVQTEIIDMETFTYQDPSWDIKDKLFARDREIANQSK